MRRIKAGVIGTGFIGPVHIEAMRRVGFVDVVALAEANETIAQAKGEELSIERVYGDYRQLLANEDIEVVHICAPNHLHFSIATEAMMAGKHIVCEKPLAKNRQEAEELVRIAKEKGVANAIHFNVRFYPLIHHVRKMIQNGDLGKIFTINGSYEQDWLIRDTDYNWRLEPEFCGDSRAIADIGSHWFDSVEFMTGLKVTEICADFATIHPIRKKPLKPLETFSVKKLQASDYVDIPINTEDYASVMLHFDSGAHGVMCVNQCAAGLKNEIIFEIWGSKAGVRINTESPNTLWIGYREKANEVLTRDPALVYPEVRDVIFVPGGHPEGFSDTSRQLFNKFYRYIASEGFKSGATPEFPTIEAGLRELVLNECIVKSARAKQWVEVK